MSEPKKPKRGRPSIPAHRKKVKPNITIDPLLLEAAREKADRLEITFSELVTRALQAAIEQGGEKLPDLPNIVDLTEAQKTTIHFVAASEIPLLHAAAGKPVTTDGDTYAPSREIASGRFAVRLHGTSMEPTYRDGSIVILREKSALNRPVLKQREVYLFVINGQKTLKVYDSRLASKKEIKDGLSYSSTGGKPKVKVLRSINPEFEEIVLSEDDDIEWLGWLDPKDNREPV